MAVFEVSNLNDNGEGSLRQAIANSNTQAGADEIVFADSLSGRQITLTSGELKISDDLNITGLGADNLAISGNNSSRVFVVNDDIYSNSIDVSIDGLTITNGVATSEVFGDLAGGGIFNGDVGRVGGENLKVSNSKVINNQGGGIFVLGEASGGAGNGSLELINSTVSGNTKRGISISSGAVTTIRDSEISNNLDSGISANAAGKTTIINSRITGNSTDGSGGGITSSTFGGRTEVEVIDSEISNNYAKGDGGGINNGVDSNLILTNSTVSGNKSADDGGGINNYFDGRVTIDNSSINNNSAVTGGGIFANRQTDVNVKNSFITGNSAENDGGGLFVSSDGSAELVNTSMFFNTANTGGAIAKDPQGDLSVINSTIALNSATDTGGVSAVAPNSYDSSNIGNTVITQNVGGDYTGEVNSLGNNFIGNKDNSNGFGDTDIAGTNEDPLNPLFAFFDNPGVQPDRSILIDAGNNDLVPEGIETDILGSPRIIDGNGDGIPIVDIGAFEAESDGNLAVLSDIDLIA